MLRKTKLLKLRKVGKIMNKDIELYALIPDGKDTWRIVNEDNIFIMDIHDYDIESICENICNDSYIERYSAEEFIEQVWDELRDNFSPQITNSVFCEHWDKFCAWCDNEIIEYLTTELLNMYKSRLLDFE